MTLRNDMDLERQKTNQILESYKNILSQQDEKILQMEQNYRKELVALNDEKRNLEILREEMNNTYQKLLDESRRRPEEEIQMFKRLTRQLEDERKNFQQERQRIEEERKKFEDFDYKLKKEQERKALEKEREKLERDKKKIKKMKSESKPSNRDLQLNALKNWLTGIGLEMYYTTFEASGYDTLDLIMMLNETDLDVMDIKTPGHRKSLLSSALLLRSKNPSAKTELAQSNDQEEWIKSVAKKEPVNNIKSITEDKSDESSDIFGSYTSISDDEDILD